MATGSSMATYAYYDQIGGVEAASEIDGFKLQMYAPLEGPAGAHHQPKSRTGSGIMFPKKTAERDDFERIVRTIDEMFYSEENAKLWCLGVEGETYTMDGDKIAKIDILSHGDTAGVCNAAYDTVPGKIIEAQSTNVDAATNATISSKAIMAAVEDALSKVGK